MKNAKDELFNDIKPFVDENKGKELLNILNKYQVKKVPRHICGECWNFEKITPDMVFHVGNFHDEGRCVLKPNVKENDSADLCKSFKKKNWNNVKGESFYGKHKHL